MLNMVLKSHKKMYNITCMDFHIIGGKMKVSLVQCNRVMNILAIVFVLISAFGLLPAYVAIGFLSGYIVVRFVMNKFIGQLDNLKDHELPSSNFAFNMLVYAALFVLMSILNVYALLASAIAVIGYRKAFFVLASKNMKEGGCDGNNY